MNDKPKSLAPIAIPIHWLMSFIAWWPLFVSGGFSILKNDMKPQEFLFWISLVLGILVLTLLWSIVHYLRFTYLVAPDGLTINSGVFIRKINHIPYGRIQTVQRRQWFFLKPLGLEQVSIETAGKESKKAEGMLAAVPTTVADAINRYRQGLTDTPTASASDPTTEGAQTEVTPAAKTPDAAYKINAHDLNQYALTSLGFIPIITAQHHAGQAVADRKAAAKQAIDAEAAKVTGNIDQDETLTATEKAAQKQAVATEADNAKQAIDKGQNADAVDKAKTDGIKAIDAQHQSGQAIKARRVAPALVKMGGTPKAATDG